MNILQVCNKVPYPPKDGGAIAILNLSTAFAEKGHHVTILAINTNKHWSDPKSIPDEYTRKIKFIYVPVDTDIHIKKLLTNLFFSRLPYNATRFISADLSEKLRTLLKNNKYDIIQLEGLYLSFYIPLIRTHSHAKIALRAHNIEHEIWQRIVATTKNPIKKFYLHLLTKRITVMEKSVIRDYDLLIPITERDLNKFQALGNQKPYHITPTGIHNKLFNVKISDHPAKKLFFIGSLDWIPNQEGLLWFLENVWKDLKKEKPDIEFHVAGRNAPHRIAEKLNELQVIFHGEIEDAYDFFDTHDVMIVPLFAGSGMRIKIIEAMARSKAIVSTSIGAEGIGAKNGEHLLIANDKEDMLTALYKILENYDFFVKLEKNSFAFAKQFFNNDRIAEGLLNFYEQQLSI